VRGASRESGATPGQESQREEETRGREAEEDVKRRRGVGKYGRGGQIHYRGEREWPDGKYQGKKGEGGSTRRRAKEREEKGTNKGQWRVAKGASELETQPRSIYYLYLERSQSMAYGSGGGGTIGLHGIGLQ